MITIQRSILILFFTATAYAQLEPKRCETPNTVLDSSYACRVDTNTPSVPFSVSIINGAKKICEVKVPRAYLNAKGISNVWSNDNSLKMEVTPLSVTPKSGIHFTNQTSINESLQPKFPSGRYAGRLRDPANAYFYLDLNQIPIANYSTSTANGRTTVLSRCAARLGNTMRWSVNLGACGCSDQMINLYFAYSSGMIFNPNQAVGVSNGQSFINLLTSSNTPDLEQNIPQSSYTNDKKIVSNRYKVCSEEATTSNENGDVFNMFNKSEILLNQYEIVYTMEQIKTYLPDLETNINLANQLDALINANDFSFKGNNESSVLYQILEDSKKIAWNLYYYDKAMSVAQKVTPNSGFRYKQVFQDIYFDFSFNRLKDHAFYSAKYGNQISNEEYNELKNALSGLCSGGSGTSQFGKCSDFYQKLALYAGIFKANAMSLKRKNLSLTNINDDIFKSGIENVNSGFNINEAILKAAIYPFIKSFYAGKRESLLQAKTQILDLERTLACAADQPAAFDGKLRSTLALLPALPLRRIPTNYEILTAMVTLDEVKKIKYENELMDAVQLRRSVLVEQELLDQHTKKVAMDGAIMAATFYATPLVARGIGWLITRSALWARIGGTATSAAKNLGLAEAIMGLGFALDARVVHSGASHLYDVLSGQCGVLLDESNIKTNKVYYDCLFESGHALAEAATASLGYAQLFKGVLSKSPNVKRTLSLIETSEGRLIAGYGADLKYVSDPGLRIHWEELALRDYKARLKDKYGHNYFKDRLGVRGYHPKIEDVYSSAKGLHTPGTENKMVNMVRLANGDGLLQAEINKALELFDPNESKFLILGYLNDPNSSVKIIAAGNQRWSVEIDWDSIRSRHNITIKTPIPSGDMQGFKDYVSGVSHELSEALGHIADKSFRNVTGVNSGFLPMIRSESDYGSWAKWFNELQFEFHAIERFKGVYSNREALHSAFYKINKRYNDDFNAIKFQMREVINGLMRTWPDTYAEQFKKFPWLFDVDLMPPEVFVMIVERWTYNNTTRYNGHLGATPIALFDVIEEAIAGLNL